MVKATGFESSICESWSGFDADTLTFYFHDAKLTDEMRNKTGVDVVNCLSIDLEKMEAEGFDDDGNEFFTVKIKMIIS